MFMYVIYAILFIIYIVVGIMEANERISGSPLSTKDAWMSVIWPLLLIWMFIKLFMLIYNNTILFICTLFKINYKKTKMYIRINDFSTRG
jgi:hypothetical protein